MLYWFIAILPFFGSAINVTNRTSENSLGYWWWTWSSSQSAPSGSNFGVAFSGWAEPYSALRDSAGIMNKLPGLKYISLGGGNANGRFSYNTVSSITGAIYAGAFSGYHGIAFDIEEGDGNLGDIFSESFAAAKSMGLKVLVTVSHSAPYGIPDSANLMRSFLSNGNIDYLSPQLYTSGTEGGNDFSIVAGVQWSEYAAAKAAVVPSIVRDYMYWDAQGYLSTQGVTTFGWIQWAQV